MASGNDFTSEMKLTNLSWNAGYTDGYSGRPVDMSKSSNESYMTSYEVGREDRIDDDEAIASGDFDILNEEERMALYGDESDKP